MTEATTVAPSEPTLGTHLEFLLTGLRRHWAMIAVLTLSVTLRAAALAAYRPSLGFYGDTYFYLSNTNPVRADSFHPAGYSVLLAVIRVTLRSVSLIPVIQDVIALASGTAIYAVCIHLGVRRGWGVLAAAGFLLNTYQIVLDEMILSEALLMGLIVLACCLCAWWRRPPVPALVVAGLAVFAATVTRSAAGVIAIPFAALLLGRTRQDLLRLGVFLAAVAIPLLGYCAWHSSADGNFTVDDKLGFFLYGRTAPFAQCSKLPASDRVLCDSRPISVRPQPAVYLWSATSPLNEHFDTARFRFPEGKLLTFAEDAIRAQPGDYLKTVAADTIPYFRWAPSNSSVQSPIYLYDFPHTLAWYGNAKVDDTGFPTASGRPTTVVPHFNPGLAGILRDVQRYVYLPGTVLVLCLGAVVLSWLRRRGDLTATALAAGGFLLIVASTATASFDYRYGLVAQPLIILAGALSLRQFPWALAPSASPESAAGGPALPPSTALE